MNADGKKKKTFVQCTNCGKIYQISHSVDVEKLYITAYCQECESRIAINLGDNISDIYKYYNVNLDDRYYD